LAFSVTTWNINSVRLRLPMVQHFLRPNSPMCCACRKRSAPTTQFPSAAFRKLGYEHVAIHGQKGYHGVAIISRHPLSDDRRRLLRIDDTRHLDGSSRRPVRGGPHP
jgi:exodeoxyribonuclease-3